MGRSFLIGVAMTLVLAGAAIPVALLATPRREAEADALERLVRYAAAPSPG